MIPLPIKKITITSIGLGIALTFSAYASDQYKSSIDRVYDLSKQIRNLPNAKHPAYNNLIKECREYLYIAMSDLADSNGWDTLGSSLPGPEICSFTGVVLERTTAEYEAKLMQARGNTRVQKQADLIEISPFSDNKAEKSNLPTNDIQRPSTFSKNTIKVENFNLKGIDIEKLKTDKAYNKSVYDKLLTLIEETKKSNFKSNINVSNLTDKCLKHMDIFWLNHLPKNNRKLKNILSKTSCYEVISVILNDEDFAKKDISILNEIIPFVEKSDLSSSWISASVKLSFKDMDTGRGEFLWKLITGGLGGREYEYQTDKTLASVAMVTLNRINKYELFLDNIE